MADGFVISDKTYAGEAAAAFIVKAITGNETVQGGHIYVKDGIKKQFTIPRWDANYEDFIQDYQPTPVSKASMTVDGQVLTPKKYMIYTEFLPQDFEDHWYATQLQPQLMDRALPPTVESVVIQEVLKRHNRYLNKAIWNNDSTLTTIYKYYDGLIRKSFLGQSNTGDTTLAVASPTTLTASNIAAEILKGWTLIPNALKYDPNMKLFCSYATYDLFMQYQIAQTYKGRDITMDGVGQFKGKEVVKIPDFPDNEYMWAKGLATPESNLWLGLNSTDDANNLQLSKLQANSDMWFIRLEMKVDVQIGWNSEIVTYGI